MEQIKNQFDQVTVTKILRGALIAGGATFAVEILQWVLTLDLGAFTSLSYAIVAILINSLKEYLKGK